VVWNLSHTCCTLESLYQELFAFSLRGLILWECTSWQLRLLVKYKGKTRHIWFFLLENRFLLTWGVFWVYEIGGIATASLLPNNWPDLLVCSFLFFFLLLFCRTGAWIKGVLLESLCFPFFVKGFFFFLISQHFFGRSISFSFYFIFIIIFY
jgi:hypothetical protein